MDAKEVMKKKGEWVAVGAAGAVLLTYAVMAFGLPDTTEIEAVKNSTANATNMLETNAAPVLTKKDFSPLKKSWATESIAKPEGKGEYVAMFKSTIVAKPIKRAGGTVEPLKPVDVPKTLMGPVIDPAETELGQVTLKWKDGRKAGVVAAAVLEYHVWRQESGKEWALLTKLPGARKTYVDQSVEPKKKYSYKVMSTTKPDKMLVGKTESDFTAVVEATIPSGTNVIYKGGSKQAANIIVKKFMAGAWKEKQFVVWPKNEEAGKEKTGEIGGKARERNPDTNKMEDVDYATGFILLEIRSDRFTGKRMEKRSHIDPSTKELVSEEVEVPFERDRLKIRFLDDEGKEQEMWAHDLKDEDGGEPK